MRAGVRGMTRQMRSASALRRSGRATESRHRARASCRTASCRTAICRSRRRSGANLRNTLHAANPESSPTETVNATRPTTMSLAMSVVRPQDLADDDDAGDLEPDRDHEQAEPHGVGDELLHLIGMERIERQAQHDRQRAETPAAEAALGGEHAQLAPYPEAIAHHPREVVEDLGQVAAGLALGQHGDGEEAD